MLWHTLLPNTYAFLSSVAYLLEFGLCDEVLIDTVWNDRANRVMVPMMVPQMTGLKKPRSIPSSGDIHLCSRDEYYDWIVAACSRCSDICRSNILDMGICINRCPDYFKRHFSSSLKPNLLDAVSSTLVYSPDGWNDREEGIVQKPLFWTSVVSMTIAAAATVIIIILYVRRRKMMRSGIAQRSTLREVGTGSRWQRSKSLSEGHGDYESGAICLFPPQNSKGREDTRKKDECVDKKPDDQSFEGRTPNNNCMNDGHSADRHACRIKPPEQLNIPASPNPGKNSGQKSKSLTWPRTSTDQTVIKVQAISESWSNNNFPTYSREETTLIKALPVQESSYLDPGTLSPVSSVLLTSISKLSNCFGDNTKTKQLYSDDEGSDIRSKEMNSVLKYDQQDYTDAIQPKDISLNTNKAGIITKEENQRNLKIRLRDPIQNTEDHILSILFR